MTRSTSLALTLFSIVLIISPWTKAYAEIQIPMPSSGGLLSDAHDGSSIAIPPPQPQCWVEALKIFQPKNNYEMETTSKVCERMGPQHQKALAFELARCHLEDLNKAILVDTTTKVGDDSEHEGNMIDDPQQCTILSSGSSAKDDPHFPNLSRCLSFLTESGTNAYTLFFAQVVQLCNRLTQHMAIDFQQHTAMQLAKISQETVNQITNILHNQHEAFQHREEEIRQRHESFYAAMQEQQEKLWEGQTSRFDEFKTWTTGLMEHWKRQAQEQKQQYEAWLINQTDLLENRANELERLQLDKIVGAIEFLQPLITLETWLIIAQHLCNLTVFALFFAMALKIVYLVTRPRRCRGSRSCLLGLVIFEGVIELMTSYVVHKGLFSGSQQTAMLSSLRQTTLCLASLVYVVGLFLSCCDFGGDNEEEYDDEDYEEDIDYVYIDDSSEEVMPDSINSFNSPVSQGGQTISSIPRGAVPLDEVYSMGRVSDAGLHKGTAQLEKVYNNHNPERSLMGRVSDVGVHKASGARSNRGFASVVSPGLEGAAKGSELDKHHHKARDTPQKKDDASAARRLAFDDKQVETTTHLQETGVSTSVTGASKPTGGNMDLKRAPAPSSLKMAPGTVRDPEFNKKRSPEEMNGSSEVLDNKMREEDYEETEDEDESLSRDSQATKRRRVEEAKEVLSGTSTKATTKEPEGTAKATVKPSMMDIDDSDDDEGYLSAKEDDQHAKKLEADKWANEHSTDDEDEDEDNEKEEKDDDNDDISMMEEDMKPVDDETEEGETSKMDSTTDIV